MTILNPIDFTDIDSKSVLNSKDSRYYYPFVTEGAVLAANKGDILTGTFSGSEIELLEDVTVSDTLIYAKVTKGVTAVDAQQPITYNEFITVNGATLYYATTGEAFKNSSDQVVFTAIQGNYEGLNIYLVNGDDYYNKLLRDYSIDPSDTNLKDPPIYQVKKVLICHTETEIFGDLIRDSRAPFDGQEILEDKYDRKLTISQECLDKWLSELDENAFYDSPKGNDTKLVTDFMRY